MKAKITAIVDLPEAYSLEEGEFIALSNLLDFFLTLKHTALEGKSKALLEKDETTKECLLKTYEEDYKLAISFLKNLKIEFEE